VQRLHQFKSGVNNPTFGNTLLNLACGKNSGEALFCLALAERDNLRPHDARDQVAQRHRTVAAILRRQLEAPVRQQRLASPHLLHSDSQN